MDFVYKAWNAKGESIDDFSKLIDHHKFYLCTRAGLLAAFCERDNYYALPGEDEGKPRSSRLALLNIIVIDQCCPNAYTKTFGGNQCLTCGNDFKALGNANAIRRAVGFMKSEWHNKDEFIGNIAPLLQNVDSMNAILLADDLWHFLQETFRPRVMIP